MCLVAGMDPLLWEGSPCPQHWLQYRMVERPRLTELAWNSGDGNAPASDDDGGDSGGGGGGGEGDGDGDVEGEGEGGGGGDDCGGVGGEDGGVMVVVVMMVCGGGGGDGGGESDGDCGVVGETISQIFLYPHLLITLFK